MKERISSSWCTFFLEGVDPFWKGFVAQSSKQEERKVVSLEEIAEKKWVHTCTSYVIQWLKLTSRHMFCNLFKK